MDNDNEKKKTFLEELQSLDEPIKRRALVIGSIVLMVIVVFVWLGYFNDVVIGGQAQTQVADNDSAATVPSPTPSTGSTTGPTVWQNMEGGMAAIYGSFTGVVNDIGHIFQAPRQYTIQPQQ